MIAKLDQSNLYSALIGLFPSAHAVIVRVGESPAQGMIEYIKGIITQRKAQVTATGDDFSKSTQDEKARTEDFLQKYLTAHNQDPAKFTSAHLLLGCVQNIFAGSDTTAIALSSTIFYLSRNPSCLAKLRMEVNAASAKGTISDPITFAQSQALPYLQAVIKEALRINPAVGLPLVRVVPTGGAMLCGKFFPEKVSANKRLSQFGKYTLLTDRSI
jgi:cytochrome P450